MKYKLAIDHARLLVVVRAAYGLPAEALQFVPVGSIGVCYLVQGAGGTQLFLKLWSDSTGSASMQWLRYIPRH